MTMNIRNFVLAGLTATGCFTANEVCSQTYPQTENGNVVYYKILSAYPEYEARNLCLHDNTSAHTSHDFLLLELDAEQRRQEWSFVTAKEGGENYHLRNHSSFHYMSVSGTWEGNYYVHNFSTKKNDSDALKITSIGNDQVTISFKEENGTRYLGASDMDAEPMKLPSNLKNSPWAWKIYKAEDLANGILNPFLPEPIITVSDHTIHVEGASDWELFDVAGRQLPPDQTLVAGGVYVIHIGNTTKKIMVK
ncbi:MAG: hypothetical protein IKN86_03520 [Bacteroidaceae bacterium]|nr:hypothetical protein [Bacteroidaceae bacterium]MBR4527601.1 hypothetical protein [Bacteroidaceae bacterium]